jgi:hypothetical protein
MKVLWSFKTVGTTHPVTLCHSPSDALSLTQWCYVTSQNIWILRSSTDKTSCSKIHSHWLIPLHYNSDKNNFISIISQGNFINYYELQHCTNFRLQIKCQHSKIHLKASTLTLQQQPHSQWPKLYHSEKFLLHFEDKVSLINLINKPNKVHKILIITFYSNMFVSKQLSQQFLWQVHKVLQLLISLQWGV